MTSDPDRMERMAVQGKSPTLALALAVEVEVEVDEAFLHCAKAFRRSRLWQTESWPDRADLPTLGKMLLDQAKPKDITAEEPDVQIEESYARRLY